MNFHTQTIDKTLLSLQTDSVGLDTVEASKRQEKYGLNVLPSKAELTLIQHFLQQFKSPIIYILLLASLMALGIQEYTDAGFILLVLFLNAVIGTYQEYSASKKAQLLQNLIKTNVMVFRDSVIHEYNALFGNAFIFK